MPTVILVLAGGPGVPDGSAEHRFEFEAALDAAGQLDAEAWQVDPRPWALRRFRPGAPVRHGDVQHDAETGWSLRVQADAEGGEETEPLIGAGALRPGAHVTLRAADGRDYAWRVVSVA
jgi:hypothetical protein